MIATLLVCACAHAGRPSSSAQWCAAPAGARTPAERIAKDGTVLDLYFRQDGVWLPNAPILVNEDFDFMLVTTMEDGVGAGLAAAKRKQSNEKRAKVLAGVALGEVETQRIGELRCCGREVYFVLWGPSTLKVVADHAGELGRGLIAEEHIAGEMDAEAVLRISGKLLLGMDCAS
jgi:hypothetical protein